MDIWIARDGVEIGAYHLKDLPDLAQAGTIRPTDHYWQPGMEDWQLTETLLDPGAWEAPPPPVAPSGPSGSERLTEAADSILKRASDLPLPVWLRPPFSKTSVAIGGACAAAIVIGTTAYFAGSNLSNERGATLPDIKQSGDSDHAANLVLRDKAIAGLREKIDKLPGRPSPGTNVLYEGFRVEITPTLAANAPWLATIRGQEDVVDPGTQESLWRSEFILETDYRDRQWTFKHYRSTTTNVRNATTTEVNTDEVNDTPPLVAIKLGLITPGPRHTPPPLGAMQDQ